MGGINLVLSPFLRAGEDKVTLRPDAANAGRGAPVRHSITVGGERVRRGESLREQEGFSLIEAVIGMLVLAIVALALLMALNTAIRARNQANVRTTAESLAYSQVEKIKAGPYEPAQGTSGNYTATITGISASYRLSTLDADGALVENAIYGIPWDVSSDQKWTQTMPADPGIQKVTVIVESNNQLVSPDGRYREIFRLIDFKVNR